MAVNLLALYTFATPSSSGNTLLITATAGYRIVVQQVCVITGGANNVFFETSTGPVAITATFPLAANGGFVLPYSELGWFQTSIGDGLIFNMSASQSTAVQLVYSLSSN